MGYGVNSIIAGLHAPPIVSCAGQVAHEPEESAVRTQVRKILASPEFRYSGRMQRFLAFVVNEKLAGRAEYLKEYTIGVEAFERPETFSPVVDPIVRVEARRLREKLTRYYQQNGCSDDIVIEIPRGQYVPLFTSRTALPAFTPVSAALTVRPFAAASVKAQAVSEALLYELVDQFVRIHGVRVTTAKDDLHSGLFLEGCVQTLAKRIPVVAHLTATPNFECQWSTALNAQPSNALAESVAGVLARRVVEHLSEGETH